MGAESLVRIANALVRTSDLLFQFVEAGHREASPAMLLDLDLRGGGWFLIARREVAVEKLDVRLSHCEGYNTVADANSQSSGLQSFAL